MKIVYVRVGSVMTLLSVLAALYQTLNNCTEHRAVSASPTLLSGHQYVLKIHDFDRKKQTILNANVFVELVQRGSLFATYTVSLFADPCRKSKPSSMDIDSAIRTPLVSGTFGPMSNTILNMSIPENLDLTGCDLCVGISNDRFPSRSVNDLAKVNVIVRYGVGSRKAKNIRYLYDPGNQLVVMAFSFIIGFAVVFIPLITTSKLNLLDGKLPQAELMSVAPSRSKFSGYEWRHRNSSRVRQRENQKSVKESHQESHPVNFLDQIATVAKQPIVRRAVSPDHDHSEAPDRAETTKRPTDDEPGRSESERPIQEAAGCVEEGQYRANSESDLIPKGTNGEMDESQESRRELTGNNLLQSAEASDKSCTEAGYLVI